LLLFVGRKPEAVALARRSREAEQAYRYLWLSSILQYIGGNLSEGDLLKAAGPSKYGQCKCNFIIGLMKLAEADRKGAREYFGKTVATHYIVSLSYNWSWAFLTRMEKDPAWPPWIPAKK
jgi:hypothetical protein